MSLAKIAGARLRPRIKRSDNLSDTLDSIINLLSNPKLLKKHLSETYIEKLSEPKKNLSRKIQGKKPFQYFFNPATGRKPAFLRHCMAYYADSFDEPDGGYLLHTSLESMAKWYEKEGKRAGGWRRVLSYHNPDNASPKKVYLTKKTRELLGRKSKNTAGVVVITYMK